MDCNIKAKQWPAEYGYEAIRMKRYLNNDLDRFDPHVDVLNHDTSRRFLAFFIYVNDVEEGGETVFPMGGTAITPETGKVVVWPAGLPFYHCGNKSESDKYILTSWFEFL